MTFRNMPPSQAVEAQVRDRAAKLDLFYDKIMACRVVVEAPHRRHHKGKLYHVRIDMTVPGGELVVKREPSRHAAHEDPYVAIRDALAIARIPTGDWQLAQIKRAARTELGMEDEG